MSDSSPRVRGVACPACGGGATWQDNPYRPFCSLTCRLADLGAWLDEGYRIAAEPIHAEGESGVP